MIEQLVAEGDTGNYYRYVCEGYSMIEQLVAEGDTGNYVDMCVRATLW